MGKITGFMEFERQEEDHLEPVARLKNYKEFVITLTDAQAKVQGARCMDCGIPFCNTGCPVNNIIPDWNDLVFHGNYRHALENLHSTNNFPEFTGRICPAPCESACTLGHQRRPGRHQVDRAQDHRHRLGARLGGAAATRAAHGHARSPSSVPDLPAWPRPSNWRASAMT